MITFNYESYNITNERGISIYEDSELIHNNELFDVGVDIEKTPFHQRAESYIDVMKKFKRLYR